MGISPERGQMNIVIYSVVVALAIAAVVLAYFSGYGKGADDQYIEYLEEEIKKYMALIDASGNGNIKTVSLEELNEIIDKNDKNNKDGNE